MDVSDIKKLRPGVHLLSEEIKDFLPHRYPFLMIDRILSIEDGKRCRGLKNVTCNEGFFNGHFPNTSIMPGVLIVEAMAQTCGILAYTMDEDPQSKFLMFSGIDKTKFKGPVVPGDQLIIDVEFIRQKMSFFIFHGVARVDGKVAAEGDLRMAMVSKPE